LAIVEEENDRGNSRPGMCDSYQCWIMSKSRKVMNDIEKTGFQILDVDGSENTEDKQRASPRL